MDAGEHEEPIAVAQVFAGEPPRLVRRFVKMVGRGINEFSMIGDGDSVIIGSSGGKDSLALALGLSLRRRRIPIDYALEAIHIDWEEYPLSDQSREGLTDFYDTIGVPLRFMRAQMIPPSFEGRFSCYLCSRNRKRILFDELAAVGGNIVALGHHLDDIVETTLMNMTLRGSFQTMMPVQRFFGGKLHVVRPLCLVAEHQIDSLVRRLALPVVHVECPYHHTNIRSRFKPIVRDLERINPDVRRAILRSTQNVVPEYLPLQNE